MHPDGKLPTLAAETELDEVVQEGAQARLAAYPATRNLTGSDKVMTTPGNFITAGCLFVTLWTAMAIMAIMLSSCKGRTVEHLSRFKPFIGEAC